MENPKTIQIETKALNVAIHSNQVLKDIDIQIPAKQLTAIIGPSGCGKTTLLKSFNRLLEIPDGIKIQGEIIVDGINIMSSGLNVPDIRKKMRLISQKPYPLPNCRFLKTSPMDCASIMTRAKRNSQRQYKIAFKKSDSGVKSKTDSMTLPHDYLSGSNNDYAYARAIAVQPEVILCDEPTSALDPIAAQQIENLRHPGPSRIRRRADGATKNQ